MAANLQLAARGSRTAPLDPLLAIGEVIQRHQQERVWAAEERAREQHILQHIADVVTGSSDAQRRLQPLAEDPFLLFV